MSLCLFVRLFYVNVCIYVIWINQTCLNFSPSQLFNSVVPLQESFFGRRFLVRAGDRDVLVSFSSMMPCLTLSNRQVRMTLRTTLRTSELCRTPLCLSFWTESMLEQPDVWGIQQKQFWTDVDQDFPKSSSEVLPWTTLQTVRCVRMDKLKIRYF